MPKLAEERGSRNEPEVVLGLTSPLPTRCPHSWRGGPCSQCLMPAGTVPRVVAPLKLSILPDVPDVPEPDDDEESDEDTERKPSTPRPPAPEGLLYADEVARVLGVSRMTVSSYTAQLRPVRAGKRYVYDAERVHAFAKERAARKEQV